MTAGSLGWTAPAGLTAVAASRLAQCELARDDGRFFSLEARPGDATGWPFRAEFPERYVAWPGAEASLIGAAGGLALAGKIPLVNLFSSFALIRACEQVRLDLCYHQANAKLFGAVGSMGSAGSADQGFPEPARLALEDLAVARSMPNMTVIAPADATAAYHATLAAGRHAGPVYLRLARDAAPRVYGDAGRDGDGGGFQIGKGIVLRQGSDLTLVAAGAGVVAESLAAAALLERDGIAARVIDLHTVKPVDRALLAQAAAETGLIVTVEEHPVQGGLGGAVAEALGDEYPVPMRILGIRDGCRERTGTRDERLRRYGLDAAAIAASAASAASARQALGGWERRRI
jgi:transketolase